MSVIGDTQTEALQPKVSALPLPIVEEAAIIDISNPVNTSLYSGKTKGACYIMETTESALVVIVASGSAPADVWYRQDNLATIVPA
jgi:hypothetical protein